ncbi:hypothetical protein [Tomitella fengzijianii]|uniref:hypothetical protein n=1 Tax=Tomitella fengzijianii TaxID=2597660 RepID=UPI0018EF22AC|nr:hypothetical protein [Tomitella fengzijianii]
MDITYAFGTGDGEVTEWTSSADLDSDGDGTADAVALDFDGDGLIDDAMWDADADGVADTTCLDVAAGPGEGERWFVDSAGDGTWATEIPVEHDAGGPGGAREPPARAHVMEAGGNPVHAGPDESGPEERGLLVDSDRDGIADTRLADSDGDGYLDTAGPVDGPRPVVGSAVEAMLGGLAAVSGPGSWGVGVQ